MKSKGLHILTIVVPITCVAIFLYMAFFNASYEHPGKYVYAAKCASCHGDKGEGIESLVPPLMAADMAKDKFDSLPCWILNGMNNPIVVNGKSYEQQMYPIALSEVEMANLLNYLSKEYLDLPYHITADSIAVKMKSCTKNL